MSYSTDSFDGQIVKLLKANAVGLLPSDTVYGLSALALSETAVRRTYDLKGRDQSKPFIILLADAQQAKDLGIDPLDLRLANKLWPAPLTVITPARNAPKYLHRGLQSLAVRVPENELLRKLLRQTGPLVSTSANLDSDPTVSTCKEAQEIFGDKLDFYVDFKILNGEASTIAQVINGQLKVIRPGAYRLEKS